MRKNSIILLNFTKPIIAIVFCVAVWYSLVAPFFYTERLQTGREIGVHIAGLFGWENFKHCGMCFYWDSSSAGGGPFFGDIYTSAFHPFVAAVSMLTNPITASNLTIVFAAAMLALSGLLYARLFSFDILPTVWLVTMMIVGGHFAGRLEIGSIGLPLSIAAYSLAVVAYLRWVAEPSVARAVQFVIALGSLFLAGQGYMQLFFVLSMIPLGYYGYKRIAFEKYVSTMLGCGLALGILLLPMAVSYMQNSSYMFKEIDAELMSVQPLGYYFFNLLIDDKDYFFSNVLSHQPYPYLYSVYVGYVTVGLALWACVRVLPGGGQSEQHANAHATRSERDVVIVWIAISIIGMLLVSGTLQRFLLWINIGVFVDFVVYLRNVVLVGSALAITCVMLSAHGIHWLLRDGIASLSKSSGGGTQRVPVFKWVVAAVMIFQMLTALSFAKKYVIVEPVDQRSMDAIEYLKSQPYGFVETQDNLQFMQVMQAGLKNITKLFYPYQVAPTFDLYATYRITSEEMKESDGWQLTKEFKNVKLYTRAANATQYVSYAFDPDGAKRDCSFTSLAGNIDVTCTAQTAQILTVHEHALPGWEASVDGKQQKLDQYGLLTVEVPQGTHTMSFRYRPWSVIVASVIALLGWIAILTLFCRDVIRHIYNALHRLVPSQQQISPAE